MNFHHRQCIQMTVVAELFSHFLFNGRFCQNQIA